MKGASEPLTNHHVLERAEKVQVVVPGIPGTLPARIVGLDKQTDVALLRIDPRPDLVPARFGSAAEVQVGQWVLAVGNPYGLDGTVSLGIVSAKGRNLAIPDRINDFIQTDAMIDRGSSGGPLVDLDGRVIGINSRGQGRGIGFTIPIDTALEVMRKFEAGGVERGYLGVSLQPLDRELAAYFCSPSSAAKRRSSCWCGRGRGAQRSRGGGCSRRRPHRPSVPSLTRYLSRVPPSPLAASDLDRAVAEAAASEPAALAAYVFGSRARGEARTGSDLDVAVLETPGRSLSLEAEDRLRRTIAQATGVPVDLACLGPASPVLAFEVLQGGRRVFARDAELADEQEERLLRRYLDTEHLRRVQREYLLGAEE